MTASNFVFLSRISNVFCVLSTSSLQLHFNYLCFQLQPSSSLHLCSQKPYPLPTGASTCHATTSATVGYRTSTFTCPDWASEDVLCGFFYTFTCITLVKSINCILSYFLLHQPGITQIDLIITIWPEMFNMK